MESFLDSLDLRGVIWRMLTGCAKEFGAACSAEQRFGNLCSYIVGEYLAPKRKFHTLSRMVSNLELSFRPEISQLMNEPLAVRTAIVFRDYVFTPGDPRNEECSALLLEKFLSECSAPVEFQTKAAGLILSTRKGSLIDSQDKAVFHDIDYRELGALPEAYAVYADSVRDEFLLQFSIGEFVEGRKAFLRRILSPQRVYQTQYFEDNFGAQAQSNIENELRSLEMELAAV